MNPEADLTGCKTPLEDLRKSALEHYENISVEAGQWSSIVPIAINYYFDELKKSGKEYLEDGI